MTCNCFYKMQFVNKLNNVTTTAIMYVEQPKINCFGDCVFVIRPKPQKQLQWQICVEMCSHSVYELINSLLCLNKATS